MDEFLKIEYERCLDLLKYYDERHLSLVKFATGATSSIISLVFGFHALSPGVQPYFWHFAAVLTGVAGFGLLAVFVAMVQNRLYFVYPARQVNAIRRAMLEKVASEFSDNQMYLTTDVRAFKLFSLHAIMNLLVALQVGVFLAFSWFAIAVDPTNVSYSIVRALVVAGVISVLLFGLSGAYLSTRGQYHPDRAVHLVKDPTK